MPIHKTINRPQTYRHSRYVPLSTICTKALRPSHMVALARLDAVIVLQLLRIPTENPLALRNCCVLAASHP
jgi:hypothetical protein